MDNTCICGHGFNAHWNTGDGCQRCDCHLYREREWVAEYYADFGEERMVEAIMEDHETAVTAE